MDGFPIIVPLTARPVLIAGGGAPALRKVRLLRKADAAITVVAARLEPELQALAEEGRIAWLRRDLAAGDGAEIAALVDGRALVVGAGGDDALDRALSAAARAARVPVNIVDRPQLSTFAFPAIVDRSPLVVAVSSGGRAPTLARRVRADIEARLPARLGRLATLAGTFRAAVTARFAEPAARRRFWEGVFDGPVPGQVIAGDETAARGAMIALVNRTSADAGGKGRVAIVGAGPGDPDLLTLKALRLIQGADVIVHDRLVGGGVLDLARRDADRIAVGKAKSRHSMAQPEINALLIRLARAGRRVVRLKGGDPFIFGRGGEELDALAAAGIATEVVPGITAAAACAAAAGIPLTHREHASSLTLVTGHGRNGEPECDWPAIARSRGTLAIYMGASTAARTAARLMAHGLAGATPVAIIENGTRPDQRVLRGTLAGLGALAESHGIEGPALIIVGEVASANGAARTAVSPPAAASA